MKKICTKCKVPKEKKDFSPHKTRIDGLQSWCRECYNERNKKYRKVDWMKTYIG